MAGKAKAHKYMVFRMGFEPNNRGGYDLSDKDFYAIGNTLYNSIETAMGAICENARKTYATDEYGYNGEYIDIELPIKISPTTYRVKVHETTEERYRTIQDLLLIYYILDTNNEFNEEEVCE